jgi:predicted dehydrogenase
MDVAPVRWGVLGVADIAVRNVIPAMLTSPLTPVVAIGSRSPDKARAAAAELGIERSYGSYEAVLDDPDVDAVYIPLPNHLHAEWTIAAAGAGKHVLCEKPLATTSVDARRMAEACQRAGVLLMEAFMYRLHPLWIAAADAARGGEIGELRAIQTVFTYFNDDPSNIRNRPDAGGGALFDVGCYAVNLARMLFGAEPSAIHAAVRVDPMIGTDVLTSALLDFDGRHATFVCSTQLEPAQRVELLGTAGRIVLEIPFNIPPDRPTRLLRIAGGEPPVAPDVRVEELPACDPYMVQGEAMSRAIRSGAAVPIAPSDSIANMEVIEAILAFAEEPFDAA